MLLPDKHLMEEYKNLNSMLKYSTEGNYTVHFFFRYNLYVTITVFIAIHLWIYESPNT